MTSDPTRRTCGVPSRLHLLAVMAMWPAWFSLKRAKTFTGYVTGSLVLAAIAMAAHEWRALLAHLAAVVFFLTGALFGVRIEQTHAASPSRQPLFTVVGIEVILTTTAYLPLASRAAMGAEIFVACVSLALEVCKTQHFSAQAASAFTRPISQE
jgi:uncharacterized membrane protein YoaK (UPF0700 family)